MKSRIAIFVMLLISGCASPVPTGRDMMVLHWPGRMAISEEKAAANNNIRIVLWDAWQGDQSAKARKPLTTIEGDPIDHYLVLEPGDVQVIVDSRRDRYAGAEKVVHYPVTAIRIGYYDGGNFVETAKPPADGHELVLLLSTPEGEFRF